MTVRRSFLLRLVDRVLASDPAFSRLRAAGRAMASLALNVAMLLVVRRFVELPTAAYGMAVVISFTASMAVRDPTVAAQVATRLFAGLAAALCIVLATALAATRLAADVAFLSVIFAAVYVRRWGPRWLAVGMIAFMSYYMGDYLRPKPSELGPVLLAIALALAGTQLVSSKVVTDDREKDFRRALLSMDRCINLILHELATASGEGRPPPDVRTALTRQTTRLREIVLMAEGFLPQGEAGSLAAEGAPSDVALALFELQLVVERLVVASWLARPDPRLVQAVLERDEPALARLATAEPGALPSPDDAPTQALLRLPHAREKLSATLGSSPSPAFDGVARAAVAHPPRPALAAPQPRWGVPPSLQAPTQVTLACAVALGAGLLISPTRWSWAVMTAFVVFSNTRSRADTAVRAIERSAGTLAGLAGGVLLATLLRGDTIASASGILVAFFLAFYFQAVSSTLNLLFSTVALALLYGVMGMFTPGILVVRLEETMAGSVAGVLAAFLVFPSRASIALGAALGDYLAALDELVKAAATPTDGADLIALSRALDRRYAALATLARPVGGPWEAVTRFGDVRGKLLLLTGCTHWARRLATSMTRARPDADDQRLVEELAACIAERTAKLAAMRTRWFERRPAPAEEARSSRVLRSVGEESPVLALEAIAGLLGRALGDAQAD